MKCENCGKNEVTFVYRSNINGQVEERHLCSECAEKLGYGRRVAANSQRMMQNFFGNSLLGGSFFDDFFSPRPFLLGRMMDDPFDDFFTEMPALSAAPARQETAQPEKKEENLVEKEEQSRFARMRELNALRLEMKRAVREENFERAAELRDQLHRLEADHGEEK